MLDLAIVGGGPGGLMSAWYLKKKLGDLCRVTIYEASDRVGGKIVSRKFDSAPAMYEAGVAEIYDYSMTGPDPLRELIQHFGLQTIPMDAEQVQLDINRMKRHFDLLCELMHKARKLGIKLLVGTDTGNNSFTPYGELHAKELEIFVKHGGYTPMEAIVAATRDNAYAVGLEGQVGELAPGKLADIIVLNKDPIADITVLQGGKHLTWVIKDGKIVDLDRPDEALTFQQAAE
jgi:imidazolonepropionase-like amidohydrolase